MGTRYLTWQQIDVLFCCDGPPAATLYETWRRAFAALLPFYTLIHRFAQVHNENSIDGCEREALISPRIEGKT